MSFQLNTSLLLGKILRIDAEGGAATYTIPPSTPFVGQTNYAPEIWAYGLRNPWRFSFDRQTGDMYIADVGQFEYEEIDFALVISASARRPRTLELERTADARCSTRALTPQQRKR